MKCNCAMNPEDLKIAPMEASETIFGEPVSNLQGSDLFVGNGKIVGTLYTINSGALADYWGPGYFMALKFDGPAFKTANAIYVGMEPSVSSGLANVKPDPDRNGTFKVTSKVQKFKVVVDYGTHVKVYLYDLTDLELYEEDGPV